MEHSFLHLLPYLIPAYAICFGIQNKVPFLYKMEWLHGFLTCTYCVGFHAGWMTWLLAWGLEGKLPAEGWHIVPSVLLWGLASSAFCYAVDAAIKWLEVNSAQPVEDEGEDQDEIE